MNKPVQFLLEIGTEEVPARFFAQALRSFQDLVGTHFEKNSIEHSDIRCFATPRRLVVTAVITADMQKTTVAEVSGPPVKAAFDSEGKPSKAAEGFARAQGVEVNDLKVKDTPKGQYIVAVKETKGQKVSKVLPSVVPEIIKGLSFPKSMRWGDHALRFVRPIRWILCLLGPSVVRFSIDGIKSGRYTYGHKLLSPGRISVKEPSGFEKLLNKHQVIVDHEKRFAQIEKEIERLTARSGIRCIRDDELMDTVNFLVERPFGVLCTFHEDYLQLAPELLITVMKDHQKYFAVQDKKGNMKNSFIVISNTNSRNIKAVREGAEKVIKARFEDARFYYTEDIKLKLIDRLELLKGMTFHEKLGSLYDKTRRIKNIAGAIAEITAQSLLPQVTAAAELCKADLTSGVVREFPELQGITGYHYAVQEGIDRDTADAIREHYKPANASDTIPGSDTGRIISLADKIDSITGFFSAGIIPSGSEDPYALRRQAQGIIQILIDSGYAISIRDLVTISMEALGVAETGFLSALDTFIIQRVEYALASMDLSDDIVKSLLREALSVNLSVLSEKGKALVRFKRSPHYGDFILAVKRVRNILPDDIKRNVQDDLLKESVEKDLHVRTIHLSEQLRSCLEKSEYQDSLHHLEAMTAHINAFFDTVLVMDKDPSIRDNRLALLSEVWDAVSLFCDFSLLSER